MNKVLHEPVYLNPCDAVVNLGSCWMLFSNSMRPAIARKPAILMAAGCIRNVPRAPLLCPARLPLGGVKIQFFPWAALISRY